MNISNKLFTQEQALQAIDALLSNMGDEAITVDHFMRLLSMSRPAAEELMMALHAQEKLELKWVPGPYYKKILKNGARL